MKHSHEAFDFGSKKQPPNEGGKNESGGKDRKKISVKGKEVIKPKPKQKTSSIKTQTKPKRSVERKEDIKPKPKQKTSSIKTQTKPKKSNNILIIATLLLLLVAGAFAYIKYYVPYAKDKSAVRKYIIANTYKLRSSRYLDENNSNVIKAFDYGNEVLVYNEGPEWAEVKIIDKFYGREYTGFLGMPKKYLANKKDFYEIEGLWGNKDARQLITQSYAKKAVVDYLHANNLMTDVPVYIQNEIYNGKKNNQVWQIFSMPNPEKNKVAISTEDSLFVIITEKENWNNKKLLVFSFNKEKDYKSKLLFDQKINPEFEVMKMVKKGSKYYLDKEVQGKRVKSKLQHNAILLSNMASDKNNKTAIVFADENGRVRMVAQ